VLGGSGWRAAKGDCAVPAFAERHRECTEFGGAPYQALMQMLTSHVRAAHRFSRSPTLCPKRRDGDGCIPGGTGSSVGIGMLHEEFVPEPGTLMLVANGLMGLAGCVTGRLRSGRPLRLPAGQALRRRTRE
jgi:hypothetical protein